MIFFSFCFFLVEVGREGGEFLVSEKSIFLLYHNLPCKTSLLFNVLLSECSKAFYQPFSCTFDRRLKQLCIMSTSITFLLLIFLDWIFPYQYSVHVRHLGEGRNLLPLSSFLGKIILSWLKKGWFFIRCQIFGLWFYAIKPLKKSLLIRSLMLGGRFRNVIKEPVCHFKTFLIFS